MKNKTNPPRSPSGNTELDKLVQSYAQWLPKGLGLVLKAELQALIKAATDEAVQAFAKDKTVISNFTCELHGKQEPVPECPKCQLNTNKGGKDA